MLRHNCCFCKQLRYGPICGLRQTRHWPMQSGQPEVSFIRLPRPTRKMRFEQVVSAVAQLDERLNAAGKKGQNWRKYLQWDEFQAQLHRQDGPDTAVLGTVLYQVRCRIRGIGAEMVRPGASSPATVSGGGRSRRQSGRQSRLRRTRRFACQAARILDGPADHGWNPGTRRFPRMD